MRTILFLVAGLFLMASLLIVAKMFSEHFPSAPNWAVALGLSLWLMITATNMWIGGFKGRLLGGRRIAHIAAAVRGSRCCGGAGALAFPLEAASRAHEWARTDSRPSATVSSRSSLRSWCWS